MNNTNQSSQNEVKKITVGSIISWILGVGSLLTVFTFLKSNLLISFLYLIVALILIPPFSKKIQSKLKIHLSRGVKVLIVLIIFFIIGTIMIQPSSNTNISSKNTNTSTDNKKAEEPKEEVVVVTATKMLADYKANEVSADSMYKGKVVEVKGLVSSIGKDILDTPYIALTNGDQYTFESVQCMFMKTQESELVNVKKDQSITLKGRVSGKLEILL